MPIKGLTNRRRLPRLGKLRTGIKQQGKTTEYPKAVDYFVTPDDEYGQKIRDLFGDKPKEIRIMFPVDDTEIIFPNWYKAYKSSVGLWCKGDGETADRVGENGIREEIECPCENLQNKNCKQIGNLVFMIPEISIAGVFQIDTSSFNSIIDINSGLDFVRSVRGRLAMEPCVLRISPREVSPDGKKKIVFTMSVAAAEGEGRKLAALAMGSNAAPIAQIEVPKNQLGAGHIEEPDLIPASVQYATEEETVTESVDTATGEVIEPEGISDETLDAVCGIMPDEDFSVPGDADPFEDDLLSDAAWKALGKLANATCKRIGYDPLKLKQEIYAKYNVKAFKDLTVSQGDEIETMLKGLEKKGE